MFSFSTAGEIIFGSGSVTRLPALVSSLGERPFLVTGKNPDRHRKVLALLNDRGYEMKSVAVSREPVVEDLRVASEEARRAGADLVVGLGGGSVIDLAKAVAAMLTNEGEVSDYLEVVGKGLPLAESPRPCIAIPTTAGTGAEVTRNSVFASREHGVKVSMRGPYLLPSVALVDPELTVSVPPQIAAYTGMDALSQLIEAFVSRKANRFTDGLCRDGIPRAARALPELFANAFELPPREEMAYASLLSGLALGNAGLGAVHGLAGPLGGMIPIPHGAACARLLPPVMRFNLDEMGALPEKADELAKLLTGDEAARTEDGIRFVEELGKTLQIPPLSAYGLSEDRLGELIEKSLVASSMKGNPVDCSEEALERILRQAL
ncbi:MAG: iron-containing alcohol dehydrogenase [Verrucomicrobiota bacterium]